MLAKQSLRRRWWHPSHSRREPTKRCKCSHRQRFCSERLAEQVDADLLVILTAVEKVCINFGKENQEALGNVSTEK